MKKQTRRNDRAVKMHQDGYSFTEIGGAIGVSRQRAWAIVKSTRGSLSTGTIDSKTVRE